MLDEFAKFKCWPVFKLSLDGLGHHDWFRMREGAEKDVIAKTKMLRDRGFCVRFQTNVHKGNVDTILPTARLGAEMGVEIIRVIRTSEAPRWEQMGGDLCLSIREYYDFGLDFCRLLLDEKLDIAVNIWQTFQLWPKTGAHEHVAAQGTERGYRDSLPVCKGNRGLIAITPEGGVLPCNQMSGILKKRGVPMPSVHDVPLMELLSGGDYLKSVCYTVGEFKEENQKCRDCPHWKRCMGGCRGLGMLYGGNYYTSHDPAKCIYFDEYYDKFEALFSEKAEMAMDNA
jgi:radical SAM protein with 4Fe4S-binding SPASM domain